MNLLIAFAYGFYLTSNLGLGLKISSKELWIMFAFYVAFVVTK